MDDGGPRTTDTRETAEWWEVTRLIFQEVVSEDLGQGLYRKTVDGRHRISVFSELSDTADELCR